MNIDDKANLQEVRTDLALALEMAKDEGYAVVGCLCSYTPVELIHAAGAIPIGLCGTTQAPIAKAEEILSADQCPKVKATFGRAVSGTCPLFPLADCILAETTCDGRKKMYELLERHKPMLVMDLPQKPEAPEALPAWRSQVEKAQQYLEAWLEVSIGKDDLRRAIRLTNRERALKHAIFEICAHRPPPIMGLALTETLTRIGHRVHIEERINGLEALLETLEDRIRTGRPACGEERPRILWTGLGSSLGCSKLLELVEAAGAVVVAQEGCGGMTRVADPVSEKGDPLTAIAERYLRVTCACMTPNSQRFEDLVHLARQFRVEGVIDLAWQFCQPFEIEAYRVKELVKERLGLPFLHVVTDFGDADLGQLNIRVEGFLEQIMARREGQNGLHRSA
jgi:benzoyl-CoA reductase/2-hydroxyglutaryl-CoA dehydratase subunit BcrC/BadD/HgdB